MPTKQKDVEVNAGAVAQQEAVNENRTSIIRNRKSGTAILPGGRRVDATPYMHVRYDMGNEANILGNPEKMLTDDWKREHAGWTYAWPIRTSDQTAALLRAGWYISVPYEAINELDPMAAIASVVTPGGKYIVWKQHVLVCIPPQYKTKLVDQYEHLAISRTVTQADSLEDMLNRRFQEGGYEAEVTMFGNPRSNKTGD